MEKLLLSQSQINSFLPSPTDSYLTVVFGFFISVNWFGPGADVSLEVAKPARSQPDKKKGEKITKKVIRHSDFLDWLSN